MADFMDQEAIEDSEEEEEGMSEDDAGRKAEKKKKTRVLSSDDEDEEEEEDEEKAREEMKGFIADEEEEEEEDGSGSGSSVSDGEGGRRKKKKKKKRRKRRSRSRSDVEEDIDEEDMELLEENLGIKIQKKRKRVRLGSDGSDENDESSQREARAAAPDESDSEGGAGGSEVGEEFPDVESRRGAEDIDDVDDERRAGDEDEDDGFIVDEDGVPIQKRRKKKKTHIFNDTARQLAEDIFGVAFDYDEFADYEGTEPGAEEESEEEDYDEDEDLDEEEIERRKQKKLSKRKRKSVKSIFDLYEPRELELRHFTYQDNEIRNTDIPERMQLRTTPVTAVPEGSDELDREAEWIFKYGFTKPTVSRQEGYTREDCTEWSRKDGTIEKIKKALDFMRQQFHEVPFIAFYRKEYVEPELKINDLWRVYYMDEQWCQLQNRKRNFRRLFERMQEFQGEELMHDLEKPVPEGIRVLSNEDLEKIDGVETHEELKDIDAFFKLYYAHDLQAMQNAQRKKREEEREARRIANKMEKKKKVKTVTNEEGEEVEIEVTDDEANKDEDEPEMDEEEILKHATRNDMYTLCRKYGIVSLSKRFGLSPEQFGENLRDGYQKHDLEQEAGHPNEIAEEYINDKFKTTTDVLGVAKFVVATQLSKEPLVRKVTREIFYERATISVHPTKKGITEIDELHDVYPTKYLKNKPVRTLTGPQWLHLLDAEEQKLITIELAPTIPSLTGNKKTHLQEAKELYQQDAFSKSVQEWNNLRAECVEMAFKKMLYPTLRQELRLKLTREAKDGVLKQCKNKLYDWLKIAKYTENFEDEDEDDWDSTGGCRVMGIMYENDMNVASYAVSVNIDGEVSDFLKLEHLMKRKNSWNEKEKFDKMKDLDSLKSFIMQKRPHAIVIGVADRMAINIKEDVEGIVNELVEGEAQFPRLGVHLMDDNLAKVYAKSTRAEQDFRDFPYVLREAISLARRLQDPLIEFSQLTGPENEILCLNYSPLQSKLSDEELLEALNIEFINRTNEVGVDVNECVAHPHTSSLVQFVGGLGPRKGAALLKTLRQMQSSQRLENRQQLVTLCHMGPKVLINCAGFIKIDTSSLGDSEVYVEVLDGSRIHNEAYEWARKMAVDALEYDEEDGNPANALEEILSDPEKLAELDLDAFAQELERQGFGNKSITLYDIRAELYHMYKDLREPYTPPDADEIFNMVTKETPQTFFIGKLVTATVNGFAYKKPQGEELDQAAPLRKGEENLWQCPFCGQDDFPELTEVWNHFDAGTCPGKAVGVKVRLDNGVNGFIPIKNLSDKTVINPEERVKVKQSLFCRITKIQTDRFSVECICKSSALVDKDDDWKPQKDEYYDLEAQKRDSETEVSKKQQERQTYIKRVIVHPSFYNIGFKEAEKLMSGMDQGDVIIRPSSKGENHLTVTWKVTDGIYQHIDVREEGKLNSFSLGQSLWIGNEEFEDLDEIIARHINPMAAHARDILNFKYCRNTDGGKREKAEEIIKAEKRAQPSKIHYFLSPSKEFAGKFMLSYMPRFKCRHEYVTVTPEGFRFRKQVFEALSSLMKWFKEHFRDPIPGTPVTPGGGRLTSRTPYGSSTTPGTGGPNITPGAMSLATGTPYGNTPGTAGYGSVNINTPYTPSGQTPFMTPYNTPGPSMTPRAHGTPGSRSGYGPGSRTPRGGSGSGTPLGGRPPPLPVSRAMPPPPSGGVTPGRHAIPPPPGGSNRGRPYPSPSYAPTAGRGAYGAPPPQLPPQQQQQAARGAASAAGGADGWQAALDSWPGGSGRSRRTPAEGTNTPRGYDQQQRTPKYGGNTPGGTSKLTPRAFGDATPLYDE